MFTFKRAKLQHFFQIYKFLAQNLQIISIILSFYHYFVILPEKRDGLPSVLLRD